MNNNRNSWIPRVLQVVAVLVSLPRWVIALMAHDGYPVPASWTWAHGIVAGFGAGMAVLEGFAVAYVIGAAVLAKRGQRPWLVGLAVLTAATFLGVLVPSDFARMSGGTIYGVLGAWPLGWMSSFCAIAATFTTLAAIGFAEAVYIDDASERAALQAQLREAQAQFESMSAEWRAVSDKLRADKDGFQVQVAELQAQLQEARDKLQDQLAPIAQARVQGKIDLPKLRQLGIEHPDWNNKQLAEAVGVHPANIGRRLEEAGLRRNGDGRLHTVEV